MAKPTPGNESAFAKACSYLNFKSRAKILAQVAAVGAALTTIALLFVLWLFADLLVWRGRVPSWRELSAYQQGQMSGVWDKTEAADRARLLGKGRAGYDESNVARLQAKSFKDMHGEEVESVWEEMLFDMLHNRVNEQAAWRAFTPSDTARSGYELDSNDHGILSLVVRELATGRTWNPVIGMAHLNSWWMWNASPSARRFLPTYLTGLTLVAGFLGVVWAFLVVLNREMAAEAVIEATTRLRRAVYHHTFRLGTLAIRAMGPSEAVSILTRHVEALHDGLFARLTSSVREPVTFLLLLAFCLAVDPLLTIVFVLFAVIVWQVGLRLIATIHTQGKVATGVAGERLTIIRESLMLMRLVKVYLMDQFNQARIERQLSRYGQAQRIRHRGDSLARPVFVIMGGFCLLLLLFVAALIILFGRLSVPGAVVLATALLCLYRPLNVWTDSRRFIKRGREGAEQVFAFLERRGDVGQVVGAEFLPPLKKVIEFDNVSLKDPSTGKMMLEHINLKIPAGQRIGLVGADNTEKQALVYLIPRLLDPSPGEIRIDDHNLRWVTLDSLRTQIAFVTLQNLVFHDTVRNNIGCGDASYTLPQIIEAAKMAHAHHFIQKLPQGYETPIGELGHQLNVSEQYRIALARAILRDPALLVIEEPEADLDEATKDLLDDTMQRLLPGRTAIFLPHRISTLKSCNTLHLISKGKLVASGTHRELMGSNKLYRHLHYLEFNEMEETA